MANTQITQSPQEYLLRPSWDAQNVRAIAKGRVVLGGGGGGSSGGGGGYWCDSPGSTGSFFFFFF